MIPRIAGDVRRHLLADRQFTAAGLGLPIADKIVRDLVG
jgi:hypothetical protein